MLCIDLTKDGMQIHPKKGEWKNSFNNIDHKLKHGKELSIRMKDSQ